MVEHGEVSVVVSLEVGALLPDSLPRITNRFEGLWHYVRTTQGQFLAGSFELISALNCGSVAKWDNGTLECVDGGVSESHLGRQPKAINSAFIAAVGLDDKLFVCGDFTKAGSKPANSVALWDAGGWKALAQSMQVKSYQSLNLAVDSAKGVLLAGEGLELIDSLVLNGIARWNGTSWSKLLPSVYKADITRMCVAEDGSLFCAGSVDSSDTRIVRALARWTGTSGTIWVCIRRILCPPLEAWLVKESCCTYAVSLIRCQPCCPQRCRVEHAHPRVVWTW